MAQHNFKNTANSAITNPESGFSGFYFDDSGIPKYKDSSGVIHDFPGSFVWKRAYNPLTPYIAKDVVSYDNSSYICIAPSTGNLPTDTDFWDPMAVRGYDGEMAAAVYDPTNVEGDAFDMDNMAEGDTNKIMTPAERTLLGQVQLGIYSTGLKTGGLLTINADTTKFDIAEGSGLIADVHSNPAVPTVTWITWTQKLANVTTYLATHESSWIGINAAGGIEQRAGEFTGIETASIIVIGKLDHLSGTITLAETLPIVVANVAQHFDYFLKERGPFIVEGNAYEANATNLKIKRTEGEIYSRGINFVNDNRRPHVLYTGDESPCNLIYNYNNGSGGWTLSSVVTDIDPDHWDDTTGTLAHVPDGKFTIQIISCHPQSSGVIINNIQYGQAVYDNMLDAIYNLKTAVNYNHNNDTDLYRAYLVVAKGATNISESTQARFFNSGKRGLFEEGDLMMDNSNMLNDAEYTLMRMQNITGLISGGVLTVNGTPGVATDFQITGGTSTYSDYSDDPTNPVLEVLSWETQVVDPHLSALLPQVWVGIQRTAYAAGEIICAASFTELEKRTIAIIGRVIGGGTSAVYAVLQYSNPAYGMQLATEDLAYALGTVNKSGNAYSAHGADLLLDISAGIAFRWGVGYSSTPESPHVISTDAEVGISTYYYHILNDHLTRIKTTIDPDHYSVADTYTTVDTGKFTVQRVYYYPGSFRTEVIYGNVQYDSLVEAENAAQNEVVYIDPVSTAVLEGSTLRAFICIQQGATALNDATKCTIIKVGNFAEGMTSIPLNPVSAVVLDDISGAGLVSGGTITVTSTTEFTVSAGYGYLIDSDGKFKKVTWGTTTGNEILGNDANYIRINEDGEVDLTIDPNFVLSSYIELGYIFAGGGTIIDIAPTPAWIGTYHTRMNTFLRKGLKTLVNYGFGVSEGSTPFSLSIGAGQLDAFLSELSYDTSTTFVKLFYTTDFGWVPKTTSPNLLEADIWNDITQPYATALKAMTTGYFKNDLVFKNSSGTNYVFCGQAEYETLEESLASQIPFTPAMLRNVSAFLARIHMKEGSTSIVSDGEIIDIRPNFDRIFGYGTAAAAAVLEHSSLSGLNNDDHTQYFNETRGDARYARALGDDDNYATDAEKTILANTSNTNSGDNATNSQYSGLVTNATHTGDATGSGALTVVAINGTNMAALATGILKNTTTTGKPSIAVAGDFPALNQNTTGSAAKWTTARSLAGNSVDGSGDVAFSNKVIVQGTADAGLTGAQFLGALATGIMKVTTSTGVITVAVAGDFPTLNQNTSGTAAKATNIVGGLAGQIPYQSAVDTTALLAAGVAGQQLESGGAAAPIWNYPTLYTSGVGVSGITLNTNYALFPAAQDTITIPIGTYKFHVRAQVTVATSTVTGILKFCPRGAGTAVGTYSGRAMGSIVMAGTSVGNIYHGVNIATASNVTATSAVAGRVYNFEFSGILNITAQGTLIPAYQFTATLTSGVVTLFAGNHMVIEKMTNTSVTTIGGWS